MDLMNDRTAIREEENRAELAELISSMVLSDGIIEPVHGIRLTRASEPTDHTHAVSKPSFCVIAQGAKEVYLGESVYRYDRTRYLLASLEVPLTGRIVEASKERPYLALRVEIDPMQVSSAMIEAGLPTPTGHGDAKAVVVSPLDAGLLDTTVRILRLLRSPTECRVLMPTIRREHLLRLLMGDQGGRLRHLPLQGGYSGHIAKAVERLRLEFDRPLRIESLAREMGMSSSGFHHHFKAVTDMSPLQFQKQIRLQEARRLMLGQNLDAASAGLRVGYDDASHFSRDYKRLFGYSPARDAERLRTMVAAD